MNAVLVPAVQRAWRWLAANMLEELPTGAPPRAREEPSIVAALCTCVLGERESSESAAWPPRSVAELSGPWGSTVPKAVQHAGLLEEGLDALDDLARRETGWRFAWLDRGGQLRSLFRFEAGQGRLSRRHAGAFMDAFLTLAAHAYLRDTPQPAPAAARRRWS